MKTKLLALLLCLLPIGLFAKDYEKEGDALFAQAQYEQAEKQYMAAIAIVGESPAIRQKQEKCSKCKSLLTKAQTAEKESRYNDAAKHYSNLYAIHPLASYQSKANAMKQKAQQVEQERQAKLEEEEDAVVFVMAEQMPEFPGGKNELEKYLSENVQYPYTAQENGIHGRVICQFVVNRDGSLSELEVVRSSGDKLLDTEAIRVIKSMPKWKPGKSRGRAVRVKYTLPISF